VQRSDPRIAAGIVALGAIALLIGGAFAGLILEGAHDLRGAASAFDLYLLRVVRFTLWQAVLSTLLSVVPALFVARALSRHPRFFGRGFILQLFTVPLALPAIVAALGILALYGRAGYFAAIGGLGALLAKQIAAANVIAYDDLGPEALYALDLMAFPAVVIIDRAGRNFHETARAQWRTP